MTDSPSRPRARGGADDEAARFRSLTAPGSRPSWRCGTDHARGTFAWQSSQPARDYVLKRKVGDTHL